MNKRIILILLSGFFIIASKVLVIDADPPKWDVSHYQPLDEPYYVYLAYNYFENGTLFGTGKEVLSGSPLLTNIITYLSLEVFGDNYLGLRFSSILFSITTFIFFVLILNKIVGNFLLQLGTALFFSLNFAFTTANLIVEPTIARMAAAIFILWLTIKWNDKASGNSKQIVWKSGIVCLLFLISYPTNAFLLGAAYISLVFYKHLWQPTFFEQGKIKLIFFESFYFVIGVIISFFIYYILIQSLGGDFFQDTSLAASTFGHRVAVEPVAYLINWLKLITGNFFRFNPLFLLLSVTAILVILINCGKRVDRKAFIIVIFVVTFVVQSAFINDFPQRKLVILLPFLILLTAHALEIIWMRFYTINRKTLLFYITISIIPVVLLVYLEQNHFRTNFLSLVSTALGVSVFLFFVLTKYRRTAIAYILFALLILPEIFLTMEHYIFNRSYHYKNTYKNLNIYNGKNFIGSKSMGFRVYNKINPHFNSYFYRNELDELWYKMDSLSNNGFVDYSIGYAEEKERFKKIGFKPILVLMSSNKTVYSKDVILYQEVMCK